MPLTRIREPIASFVASLPRNLDHTVVFRGARLEEILLKANALKNDILSSSSSDRNDPVCIATEDRSSLLIALMASLAGAPPLLIPYALRQGVVDEACREVGASRSLSDDVFHQIAISKGASPEITLERSLDRPFVYLYTGGSTSRPKLWGKTPRNLFAEAFYLREMFSSDANDRFLAMVSPLHIYGLLFSVLLPFVSAAPIIDATPFYAGEILESIEADQPTILVASPMHFKTLTPRRFLVPSLRLALSSGGPLDRNAAEHFQRSTRARVIEIYGSTETGGIASRQLDQDWTNWTLLDPVSWNVVGGRMAVDSPFLSPELRRDDLGFFITGDRVRRIGSKSFELLGRIDGIVKIAGNRVDVADVERRISSIDGVKNAYVLVVQRGRGNEPALSALIVSGMSEDAIRESFRHVLGPLEIPKTIRIVEEIPLNPIGKRDRQASLCLLENLEKGRSSLL